jgi:RNA polymerase sigma-70 factor (ECF subfamily)
MSSDAEIIAASTADSRAFEAIFDRHYATIYSYLARRGGVDLAEHLAAETFVVAFAGRRRYDSDRPDARPWLLGIATNLLRHHRRSEERRLRAYARLDQTDSSPSEADAADARVDASRAVPALVQGLAALPATDRDALLLLAWADLTYQEIAQALRVPIGTVRSRLHRARRRMRELLRASGQYRAETEGDRAVSG